MTYSVTQLISNAYYTSGIVARGYETVSGEQYTDGLALLNALLDFKTVDKRTIPFFTPYTFNAVIGQEMYFVPNLIEVESITFNIGTVRFSMSEQQRKQYFGAPRVDNISALPFNWHMENTIGGANIYMYFLPAGEYPIKIFGKFSLSNITATTDLSTVFDNFYIEYLRYLLADYICEFNNIDMPMRSSARLREYEKKIIDFSPLDFTVRKVSTLQKDSGYNWADVNIGLGWRP